MKIEKFKRIHVVVLDSVGIGEAPDAKLFGDVGADTLGNTAKAMDGLHMPNMAKLGLSNIRQIEGVPVAKNQLLCMEKCKKPQLGKIP